MRGNARGVGERRACLSPLLSLSPLPLPHLELEHVLRLVEDAQDGRLLFLQGQAPLFGLRGGERKRGNVF